MSVETICLIFLILAGFVAQQIVGDNETTHVKDRVQSEPEEHNRTYYKRKKKSMKTKIIRFLGKCGCEPEEVDDYIWFIYQGNRLRLYVNVEMGYTEIGAGFSSDDYTERWILQESIGRTNASILYGKVYIGDERNYIVTIQCRSLTVDAFKKNFHIYCQVIVRMALEVGEEYEKIKNEIKQQNNAPRAETIN